MILKNARKLEYTSSYMNTFQKKLQKLENKIGSRLKNQERKVNMLYQFIIKFSGEKRDIQKTLHKFVLMFQKNLNFFFCFCEEVSLQREMNFEVEDENFEDIF